MSKRNINAVSNPQVVFQKAAAYGISAQHIRISRNKDKKYDVFDPTRQEWISFGDINFQDYTKHRDEKRRALYIARASKIPGDWKTNKYSANNLAIHLLW